MVFVLYYKNNRSKILDKVNTKTKQAAEQHFARKKRQTVKECNEKYDIEYFRPPNSIEKRELFKKSTQVVVDDFHIMPDGTKMPGKTHEEYLKTTATSRVNKKTTKKNRNSAKNFLSY